MYKFRKSKYSDIFTIIKIKNQGKKALKNQNINQWQNGQPNIFDFLRDIKNSSSFVATKNDKIIGIVSCLTENEPCYDRIFDGSFSKADKYLTIHRLSTRTEFLCKGVSSFLLKNSEDIARELNIKSIRIDTHEKNLNAQKCFVKNGFKYCGKVMLDLPKGDNLRIAYEKIIDIKGIL